MSQQQLLNKKEELSFWLKNNPSHHPNHAVVQKDLRDVETQLAELEKAKSLKVNF